MFLLTFTTLVASKCAPPPSPETAGTGAAVTVPKEMSANKRARLSTGGAVPKVSNTVFRVLSRSALSYAHGGSMRVAAKALVR